MARLFVRKFKGVNIIAKLKEKEENLLKNKPGLVKEWNYRKNKLLRPEDYALNSHEKVWWMCYK